MKTKMTALEKLRAYSRAIQEEEDRKRKIKQAKKEAKAKTKEEKAGKKTKTTKKETILDIHGGVLEEIYINTDEDLETELALLKTGKKRAIKYHIKHERHREILDRAWGL